MATKKYRELPSRFQFGDKVQLNFHDSGTITNAEIIKIHFTESQVFYDVDVKSHYLKSNPNEPYEYWDDDEHAYYTRLYNIEATNISPLEK